MERTSLLGRIIELLAPRACMICGCRLSADEHVICTSCNLQLPRTGFTDNPYDNEMARLFWGRIPVERCAAWFYYQSGSGAAQILYQLKYRHHPEAGEMVGRMMAEEWSASGFFDDIDMLIPIPLAPKRQRQRGYNQSQEIARGIHRHTHIPIGKGIALRKHFLHSQTKMSRWERAENVEGAYELIDAEAISGKHLLLIDDVVTTGATICSCAKELLKAGGVRISILAIGYTKS